jgi:hypothetical protein
MILCIVLPFKKFKAWPSTWLAEFKGWITKVKTSF